ncbi:hypothetical protein PSN45_003600 [Yamadazyma tenuis]|uniref:DUF410-domain-containing protein n=1 Tax=Candida tenuis (strain ATCC 10573 / BCRC 21748 / CBS 615 / JCM 9827 / NBRC 10315 / NRRL Y-1498 / VKM Y-70) TaxID=590646 RepID=G3AZN1_CANTC|nr:DUF410-domain-containing protein [Yamadazyma tenuis ATCC 10573]EGV65624.1 DUF410-domain-containing protein [Yamadazyma tenuis ATCC 10573]WEJ96065.1 hypothetical protein PSN45_003600 [Yamadazyma tenuis]
MSDKLSRTIQRFQAKIDSGSFYEAHQTLRTIANRYIKAKQYDEAINLLYQGSVILAKNKEYTSACDLIVYLLEVYHESSKTIDDKDAKDKIIEVISYIPSSDPGLADLSKRAVEWSKNESNKFGDHDLHNLFGTKFLNSLGESKADDVEKRKIFSVGEFHSILGNSSSLNTYTDFLYQWAKSSDEDEGIFITRAVVNYAYLKNIEFAKECLSKFMAKLIKDSPNYETLTQDHHTVYYYPQKSVINFVQLLVITLCKQDAGHKFLKLFDLYKADLTHYQLVGPVEYLGRFYFNLKLGNPAANQNMFANLMGDLFK